MKSLDQSKVPGVKKMILAVSIAVPIVVAVLFKIKIETSAFGFLPFVYATINGLTALTLLAALVAVKKRNFELHRSLIRFSLFLSLIFLVLYVLYHMTSDPTIYGDSNHDGKADLLEKVRIGNWAYIYYFLLFSHILLSIVVIPLVLFSYLKAWEGNYESHKKWVKFSFPLWLYVAVSGVLVFWMISPFYK